MYMLDDFAPVTFSYIYINGVFTFAINLFIHFITVDKTDVGSTSLLLQAIQTEMIDIK